MQHSTSEILVSYDALADGRVLLTMVVPQSGGKSQVYKANICPCCLDAPAHSHKYWCSANAARNIAGLLGNTFKYLDDAINGGPIWSVLPKSFVSREEFERDASANIGLIMNDKNGAESICFRLNEKDGSEILVVKCDPASE